MGEDNEEEGDQAGKQEEKVNTLLIAVTCELTPRIMCHTQVYLPGQTLEEGEELVHDRSAYLMYHSVSTV